MLRPGDGSLTSPSPQRQDFDTGELDHGWAADALDLSEERGASGLAVDPEQRRWLGFGLGGAGILVAILVGILVANRSDSADVDDAAAPEPSATIEPVEDVASEAASTDAPVAEPETARGGRARARVASGSKAGAVAGSASKPAASSGSASKPAAPSVSSGVQGQLR